jgi:hypothetical protein
MMEPLTDSDEADNEPLTGLSTNETELIASFEVHLASCMEYFDQLFKTKQRTPP